MTRSRFTTLGTLAALALSTSVSAQTLNVGTTPTETLLAAGQMANPLPIVAQTARSSEDVDLISESMPSTSWGSVNLHKADITAATEAGSDSSEAGGLFSSTKGRLSMVGIAGLAGAGYLAFNSGSSTTSPEGALSPSTLPGTGNVAFATNPEPASMALMALGLGALGLVARRRHTR